MNPVAGLLDESRLLLVTGKGGTGKTTAEMQDINTFLNASWYFPDPDDYPLGWFMPIGDYPQRFYQPKIAYNGNTDIQTPRIDKMAAEGLRFTQALAGCSVCGPLRCTLMTGKHMGHASVRSNDGGTPLRGGQ